MKPPIPAKKAQAALEFLMTYGWALIAVLAAIGAFTYLGILNTDKLIPEQCTITTGFECGDFVLRAPVTFQRSEIEMEVINHFPETIWIQIDTVESVNTIHSFNKCKWFDQPNFKNTDLPSNFWLIKPGERAYMGCTPGSLADFVYVAGEKEEVDIKFVYKAVSDKYNKTGYARIVAQVIE